MRILLFAQHYWPEDIAGALLATQLSEDLVKRGHEVTFVTCFPNYPKGRIREGYRGRLFQREEHKGVRIIRSWHWVAPRDVLWRRYVEYGVFSFSAFFAALAARRSDVIMSFSPPFPLALTVWLLSRLRQTPWILRIEDLFPEYAIKAGVIRNGLLIGVLSRLERLFYRKAAHISVISEGFSQNLAGRGVPPEKLSVIPVWADAAEIKPMSKETAFRDEWGWQEKFIVLYTGNIGYTCALEDVLDAAEALLPRTEIQFVIVGEGAKKAGLMGHARDKDLSNVIFWPFQPRERFPELLATSDVTLVTLNDLSSTTSLPSKTFSYLAAARPVLTVAPLDSELSEIIRFADAGVCVPAGQPGKIAAAILWLEENEQARTKMGENGRKLLETHFSRQHCVALYERMLKRFAKGN